jgi:hypothetical protein
VLYPLIGARLHGWLDDLVALTYLVGCWALQLTGAALAVALLGAAVHFLLTRFTDYPQGWIKVLPFRAHAFIELAEGMAVLAAAALIGSAAPPLARGFLALMGFSQVTAFAISDYRWPATVRGA